MLCLFKHMVKVIFVKIYLMMKLELLYTQNYFAGIGLYKSSLDSFDSGFTLNFGVIEAVSILS